MVYSRFNIEASLLDFILSQLVNWVYFDWSLSPWVITVPYELYFWSTRLVYGFPYLLLDRTCLSDADSSELSEAEAIIERHVFSRVHEFAMFPNGDVDLERDQ